MIILVLKFKEASHGLTVYIFYTLENNFPHKKISRFLIGYQGMTDFCYSFADVLFLFWGIISPQCISYKHLVSETVFLAVRKSPGTTRRGFFFTAKKGAQKSYATVFLKISTI